jgi:membrane-associated phospholipid phosphatase
MATVFSLMDLEVFQYINSQVASPFLDMPMATLSSWAVWWPLAILAGVACGGFGGFRGRAMLIAAGLSLGLCDGVVCRNMKKISERPRPHETMSGIRTIDLAKATPRVLAVFLPLREKVSKVEIPAESGRSFPSSHAGNCFALATVVWLFYRRWGWLAFVPASLVALSRMYVGVHWPTDVLAGSLIGVLCAFAVTWFLGFVWKRYVPRLNPALYKAHPEILS